MIRICTPYYNVICSETRKSVEGLGDGIAHEWVKCQGTLIAEARNALVRGNGTNVRKWQTMSGDWTHLLCLDADISFRPEQLQRLIDHNLPIVSGAYVERKDNSRYCGGWYDLVPGNIGKHIPRSMTGLQKVDWVGAGFLLVKRHVFEKLPYPWFRHEWIHYDHEGVHYQTQSGDDLSFCLQAQKHGFNVYCDCDCVVKHHIGEEPMMPPTEQRQSQQPNEQRKTVDQIELENSKVLNTSMAIVLRNTEQLCGALRNSADQVAALQKENEDLKQVIVKLNKDIADLKGEAIERAEAPVIEEKAKEATSPVAG